MNSETLDRRRLEKLVAAILEPIAENYRQGPISRDRAYEALNALACATAVVLAGCNDPKALQFFITALNQQLQAGDGESAEWMRKSNAN